MLVAAGRLVPAADAESESSSDPDAPTGGAGSAGAAGNEVEDTGPETDAAGAARKAKKRLRNMKKRMRTAGFDPGLIDERSTERERVMQGLVRQTDALIRQRAQIGAERAAAVVMPAPAQVRPRLLLPDVGEEEIPVDIRELYTVACQPSSGYNGDYRVHDKPLYEAMLGQNGDGLGQAKLPGANSYTKYEGGV